eukprot:CAMPEP_0184498382 /NCGR_PEP_ID=MMETSP0113_2-20130426/38808_1 /TAXON_ID=91329 /ORGANISM="Norrisiella sphaerica, Strain BC52" /LENGTH=502 /DNA_ID=CAMNT_0026885861 /DNA_START=58 /DNA_END=1563 /DNA_ORIENTATION=-
MEQHLPRLMLKLVQQLRARSQGTRDMTYNGIRDIFTLVGDRFLKYTVEAMRRSLSRGYQLQVLQYGVNVILQALHTKRFGSSIASGNTKDKDQKTPENSIASAEKNEDEEAGGSVTGLNDSVMVLTTVLLNDLLGTPAQHRTVEAIVSALREARSCKSLSSLQMMCRLLSLRASKTRAERVREAEEERERKCREGAGGDSDSEMSEEGDNLDFPYNLDRKHDVSTGRRRKTVDIHAGTGVYHVLEALQTRAAAARSLSDLKVISQAFYHVGQGFIANPGITAERVLETIYPLLDLGTNTIKAGAAQARVESEGKQEREGTDAKEREKAEREAREKRFEEKRARGEVKPSKADTLSINPTGRLQESESSKPVRTGGSEACAEFAMGLLLHAVAKMGAKRLPGHMDRIVDRIATLCRSPDTGGARGTRLRAQIIEALTILFRNMPSLSAIERHVSLLSSFLFKHMRSGSEELLAKSFKGVAAIVRHCRYFRPTPEQGRLLLSFV